MLVCNCLFDVFLCQRRVVLELLKRFPRVKDPGEVILPGVYDGWDDGSQILSIVDLEVVIIPLVKHLGLNHGGALRLLRPIHLLIGSHGHREAPLLLPVITLVEWVELRLRLILGIHHHCHLFHRGARRSIHSLHAHSLVLRRLLLRLLDRESSSVGIKGRHVRS